MSDNPRSIFLMRYFFPSLFLAYALFYLCACVPESKRILTEVDVSVQNLKVQHIHDFRNQQNVDSLFYYLSDSDPTFRFLAAEAFASFQDKRALDSLYILLDDPIVKVRSMAAYAIGQIADPLSETELISSFRQKDTMSLDNGGNAQILAAVGKLGKAALVESIATADGYRDTDTLLLIGQIKSLYQFALRGIHTPVVTQKITQTVRNRNLPQKVRLYAAHYLSRAKELDIEQVKFQLAEALTDEQDPDIKMALALGLRHTADTEIQATLLGQLSLQQDYRVTCNLLRTLVSYDYNTCLPQVLEFLKSENIHIARAAINFVKEKGTPTDAPVFRNIARDSIPWQVKTELYEATFDILPYFYTKTKNATRWQVTQELKATDNPYAQIGYLKALGKDPESYELIMKFAKESTDPRVRTGAIEALGTVLAHPDFNFVYQNLSRSVRRKILAFLMPAIESTDEGMVGAAANIIADPKTALKDLIDSTQFLLDARERLRVPAQIESVHAVEKALGFLRGVSNPVLTKVSAIKSTPWALTREFKAGTNAIVKTSRGNFTIDLFLSRVPSTVLNFIELANKQFYDSLTFHRVVPNFVIQTGSPRGDNYGGADYVISSELGPLDYDGEGYVGMASAGRHTESTQWFVTHSPTPHLDGKYTIFGKVSAGMDVVHNIQVGDVITDIIITDL